MEDIFTHIYKTNLWGNNHNENYSGSSGDGSSIEYNTKYIQILKKVINDYKINSVVDLGCGDFRIGKLLYDDIDIIYTGYDTYKDVIDYNKMKYQEPKYTFKYLDFYENRESIVSGDMCILKDVIQHWSLCEIYIFLDYLTKSGKFKYILIINCCNQGIDNSDCVTGDWRPLSCKFLPLRRYNAIEIDRYNTKEVCIISTS